MFRVHKSESKKNVKHFKTKKFIKIQKKNKTNQCKDLLDLFLLPVSSDHTNFIMEYNKIARAKELLIKTKSRSRKGEEQKTPTKYTCRMSL